MGNRERANFGLASAALIGVAGVWGLSFEWVLITQI